MLSTTVLRMSIGVPSAYPNISESLAGSPVGEWLMVAVSLPMEANPAGPGDLPAQDRGWLADHGIEWNPDDAG